LIAKNAKTERTGFRGSGRIRNLQKFTPRFADGAEPEFLVRAILEETGIFITGVAFCFEKWNEARNSGSTFMLS
jgi:hypothetical protein